MKRASGTGDSPELGPGRVHVWLAEAGGWGEARARAVAVLDDEERRRFERYRFEEDRARFALGRAGLRSLLGRYAGVPPSAVKLVSTPYGRPVADPDSPVAGIDFSVSHAGRRVLLAFTRGLAVGVDVERGRPGLDAEGLVRRFFSPLEVAAFLELGADRRAEAFLALWTRKEAFVKALGRGLSCPLSSFAVTAEPGAPPRLRHAPPGLDPVDWSLCDLAAGPGYRAALAVRHPSPDVSLYEFSLLEFEAL